MKRLISTLAIALLCDGASAQDTEESYKPEAGDKNLEVQFTPFGSQVITINGIRFRQFKSETKALRLNVFLGLDADTDITQQEDDTNPELKNKYSSFSLNLRPGFEKHLAGTKRLSPYVGGELDLAWRRTVDASDRESGADVETDKIIDQSGYFRIGLNAIAGFDYYIAKKLYMGTEIGYGFSFTKDSKIKFESTESGIPDQDPVKRGGSFDLGPNVNASIRLGYIF